MDQINSKRIFPLMAWTHCPPGNQISPSWCGRITKIHIYQVSKNARSTKPIYEEDSEDTSINKTGDITNLELEGIEMMGTPGRTYTDQI